MFRSSFSILKVSIPANKKRGEEEAKGLLIRTITEMRPSNINHGHRGKMECFAVCELSVEGQPQETCDIDGVTAHSPRKLPYECGSLKANWTVLSFLYFYRLCGRLLRNQARRFTTIRKMPPTSTWKLWGGDHLHVGIYDDSSSAVLF